MKRCAYCSGINNDDANFCQFCGKRFVPSAQTFTTRPDTDSPPTITQKTITNSHPDATPFPASRQTPSSDLTKNQNFERETTQNQGFSRPTARGLPQTPDRKNITTPDSVLTAKKGFPIPIPIAIAGLVGVLVIAGVSIFFLLNRNQDDPAESSIAATQSYEATMAALVEFYSDGQIDAGTPVPAESADATTTLEYTGEYCEPEKAAAALKKLQSIYGSGVEALDSSSGDSTSDGGKTSLSSIDKLFISVAVKFKQFRLSMVDVPPCLEPAKTSLDNAYEGVGMLMKVDEETSNEDLFVLILGTGLELSSYEDEIERIQACLPVGCQPVE